MNHSAVAASGRAIDRPAALLSLLLVGSVTEAILLILPSFVGAIGDFLHLSPLLTGLAGVRRPCGHRALDCHRSLVAAAGVMAADSWLGAGAVLSAERALLLGHGI